MVGQNSSIWVSSPRTQRALGKEPCLVLGKSPFRGRSPSSGLQLLAELTDRNPD